MEQKQLKIMIKYIKRRIEAYKLGISYKQYKKLKKSRIL